MAIKFFYSLPKELRKSVMNIHFFVCPSRTSVTKSVTCSYVCVTREKLFSMLKT